MPKTKQRFMLFFYIVIYIGIAFAGFAIAYYVKTSFFAPANVTSQQASKQTAVTPPATPNGWKIYTNTDAHVRFDYPSTDKVQTKAYGFGVSSSLFQTSKGVTDFQILFLPKALASTVGQDFDSYYAIPDNTTKAIKSPFSQDNTTEQFTKIKNRTINGLRALDYTSIASNAKPGTSAEIGTFVEVGSNLMLISTGKNNRATLEKMIETLKYSN